MPGGGRGGGKLTAMVGGACISQQKRKNLSTEEKISQQRRKNLSTGEKISQQRRKNLSTENKNISTKEKISQQGKTISQQKRKNLSTEKKNISTKEKISQQERKSLNKGGVFLFCCCQPANGGRITGTKNIYVVNTMVLTTWMFF